MTEISFSISNLGIGIIGVIAIAGLLVGVYSIQSEPVVLGGHAHKEPVALQSDLDDLDTRLIKQENFKDMDAKHLFALQSDVEDLEDVDAEFATKISLLEADKDVTTQPTTPTPSTDTIDLQLRISNIAGQSSSTYPRDISGLIINGFSGFSSTDYLITIKDPSGAFVKDKFGTTTSKGKISEGWAPRNALEGKYIVTVTIQGKTDSIQFNLT